MKYIILIFFFPICLCAQSEDLSAFDHLVNKTWVANGTWGDGSPFKQEIEFRYHMEKNVVFVRSLGFTNKEQTEFGLRNLGVRKIDPISNKLKFWEFDVFGGTTEGEVITKGKNIYYQYDYDTTLVTDAWEFVNDTTYHFTVGQFENSAWKQKYLECTFQEKHR